MKTGCPNFTGYMIGQNETQVLIGRTRCKQWSCAYCAKQNMFEWQAKLIHGVNHIDVENWSFLSVTSHENATNEYQSLKNLQAGWQRLQQRLRRVVTSHELPKLNYARVYEYHKNKRVHMHLITTFTSSKYITKRGRRPKSPGRWLKDNARECGMGYQTDYQVINGGNGLVVWYVTKYLTKQEEVWPKGTRLVQTSQGWPRKQVEESDNYDWKLQSEVDEYDLNRWFRMGKDVYDLNAHESVTYDMLDEHGYYKVEG